ncbi:MAG: glycosyltransferase [Candidatus Aenigmarchaeota archaeon]|nr:glycosyltransferase [Candidatus Aenigmarchaeota archaeon]
MMYPIDVAYLVFIFITLYFSILFFLLFLRNRRLIKKIPKLVRHPSVSIIVPAYNEEKVIGKTIKSLKKLIYPKNKLELIIVNDGSTDKTGEIARSFKGIKVFDKINQGKKAYALNFGLKKAKGEIVGCIDADSFPKSNVLLKTVPFFNTPKVAAVTTSIFVKEPKKLIQKLQYLEYIMIVWSRKLLEFLDGIYVTPGAMSLYRKSVLKEVGGFDEKNVTEDIEIAWRLLRKGYLIKMSTPAKVYTNAPSSFKKWWKQRIRWNIGGLQTSIKHIDTIFRSRFRSLGVFVVPFFVLSYLISLIGFIVFVYVLGTAAYDYSNLLLKSFIYTSNPIKYTNFLDFLILPNVFMVFGLSIFILSVVWIAIGLKTTGTKIGGFIGVYKVLIYVTLYITIFPIVLIDSIFKFLRSKEYRWR